MLYLVIKSPKILIGEHFMMKVSVVVPMYNSAKFLDVTITSILQQTFKDFELILVDDCSTDKTLDIAKSFRDDRIKILQTEKNLGYPGATRNIGLKAATCEYIFFMDHDDIILPYAFERLVKVADTTNADVITTTSWYICPDLSSVENMGDTKLSTIRLKFPAPVSENVKVRLWNEMVLEGMHVAPWCYFYRRKFLISNNIRFPAEVAEDVFFTVDVLFLTSNVVKVDFPFYIWRKFDSSASHDVSRAYKNIQSMLKLCDYLVKKFEPFNDSLFTSEFIFHQIDGAMDSCLAPFFKIDDDTAMWALNEITRAIEPRFGENTLFVRSILHGYFQGRNAINENHRLKEQFELS